MAIINVSPSTNISTLIASASVSEGDVLLLEEGVYYQSVLVSKNNIRIISENCRAVFNGFGFLASAFILNGVTGVEVFGVTIRDYVAYGIYVNGGSANRIISNTIYDTGSSGIHLVASSANLIWRNWVRNVQDGIFMITVSTNNQVIENFVRDCAYDGLESFLSEDANNTFIDNTVQDCGDNCIEAFGRNCLVYRNNVSHADNTGCYLAIGSIVAIENRSEYNRNGCYLNSPNSFIARNNFNHNTGTGLRVLDDYNIIQNNLIKDNENSGLVLESTADYNFIYKNKIECNTPLDIVTGGGTGNNFLRNQTGCRPKCD